MTSSGRHGRWGRAIRALIVLWCGAAGAWLGWRWHLRGPRPPLPQAAVAPVALAACDGVASYAAAVVTGEVRLHQSLLTNGVLSAETLQAAVTLQLRYAFASAQNAPAGPTTLTPDGAPHDITVLAQRTVPYGNALTLDWRTDPQLVPESAYVKSALARQRLAATDAAVAVTYEAQLGLAVCDHRGDRATTFRLPVPHDPYLLYWHIDKEQRREQVYGKKRALTFPCADPEIADYDHPEYLWYFWQPQRKEPDCPRLLPTPQVLGWVTLKLVERQPPSGDFARLRRYFAAAPAGVTAAPLRAVLVFGYLDHQVARPNLIELQRCLAAAHAHPLAPGSDCAYGEWGTAQYARFLQTIGTVLAEDSRVVRAHAEVLEAELHGRLQRSGRRIHLTAYLTETDSLAPAPYVPHHLPLLLAALREAEVVVYAGHSGLGSNFALAQLEKLASPEVVDAALRSSRLRLLGFVGCYTYSYFGRDFGRLVEGRPGEAMFVYTGNAVEKTAASAVHILHTLDCILQSPDGVLRPEACTVPPGGEPTPPDFLIYEPAR